MPDVNWMVNSRTYRRPMEGAVIAPLQPTKFGTSWNDFGLPPLGQNKAKPAKFNRLPMTMVEHLNMKVAQQITCR